jgi:hypothetical protein
MVGGKTENAPWVDTALNILCALLLSALSWSLLAVAQFNENHVFANAGVLDATTHGLVEWLRNAEMHKKALADLFFPTQSIFGMGLAVAFITPVLCIAATLGKRYRRVILTCLALSLAVDLHFLLQFQGNNSANGGHDGVDFFVSALIHILASAVAIFTCASYWASRYFANKKARCRLGSAALR